MSLLSIRNLSSGYGKLTILRDLDLGIEKGEIGVVLGANGAGKTTTLRAICGMTWRKGEIRLEEKNISALPTASIAAAGVAHVPQGRGTFAEFTVEENLMLGAYRRRDADAVKKDAERWMESFPRLRERLHQRAGSLSGGEQQMLAVARAMMSRPKLLLLDEPSLGLAPVVTQELFRALARINDEMKTTMLIVEQNAHLSLSIAHRAFVLEHGYLALSGDADSVRNNESVRRIYLGYE